MKESKDGVGKGFSGLSALVSDVSEEITRAKEAADKPDPLPNVDSPASQANNVEPARTGNPLGGERKTEGGLNPWIFVLVVGTIILFGWASTQNKPEPPAYPYPEAVAPEPEPVFEPQAADEPEPERPTEQIDTEAPASNEMLPPVGSGRLFNSSQIRYCLSEKIRLGAVGDLVNDRSDSEISTFNSRVNDYNSRCGNFQYYRGELERVRAELEPERGDIADKAQKEWVRKFLSARSAPSPAQEEQSVSETSSPDQTENVDQPTNTQTQLNQGPFRSPSAPFVSQAYRPESTDRPRTTLPANAKPNYLGNGWECNRGYRKVGNECDAVQIPPNGKLNYLGNDWECNRGYRKEGNECDAVQIPVNGKLNYLGNDWECNRGYGKFGRDCLPIEVPANADLNYLGNGWECNRGYRKVGNECQPL